MNGEKPWDKRRPNIPGVPNNPKHEPKSQENSVGSSGNLMPGIPGIPGLPRPQIKPNQSSVGFKSKGPRKGIFAFSVIVAVTGIALFANSSLGDNQRSSIGSSSTTNVPISESSSKNASDETLTQWETLAKSVVYIEATGATCNWSGSGSIVLDGSYVLTNQHVSGDGECSLRVGFTDSTDTEPGTFVHAEVLISDAAIDLAVIRLLDQGGAPYSSAEHRPLEIEDSGLKLGDKIYTLGYQTTNPTELLKFVTDLEAFLVDIRFRPYSPAPQWRKAIPPKRST